MTDPTPLGHIIIGLLLIRPRTGYAVRKVFETTALGQYSSSPGSIYPALKRLEREGLVERLAEESRSARPTTYFNVTEAGRTRFAAWLTQPIERSDVARGVGELMARFAFMDQLPRDESIRLLKAFEREVTAHLEELVAFDEREGAQLPPMSRLTFQSGIEVCRTHARWAGETAERLEREG